MQEVIRALVGHLEVDPKRCKEAVGRGEASTNVALIKYWGKRDTLLNLPWTDSISVSLPGLCAKTSISKSEQGSQIFLNDVLLPARHPFAERICSFLNFFHCEKAQVKGFTVSTHLNIPHSAGLASSACGFAALILALNDFYQWNLPVQELSILARLGSGSACRSLFSGFVKWQAGVRSDGMDSFALPLPWKWEGLCLGVLLISEAEKPISSRDAMNRTVATSRLYSAWPDQVQQDQQELERSIVSKNFEAFGRVVEQNAMSMHATMMSSWPPILYALPDTLIVIKKVVRLREQGLSIFLTQDAGPNLKLLFQVKDFEKVHQLFSFRHIISLF